MNNNLLPIPLLNGGKTSSLLHNILHTSNTTLNMVNNLIPIYTNIKPVIKNVKTIHKAFKNNLSKDNNKNIIKEVKEVKIPPKEKKDIIYSDNSISFFQ